MNEDDSQLLRLAKAGIGVGLLAKDSLSSVIGDVLSETDLSKERRDKLEEKLVERTESELEDLEGTFKERVEEGRRQAGLASEESVTELRERVSELEERLAELEEE